MAEYDTEDEGYVSKNAVESIKEETIDSDEKYESHDSVINLLTAAQMADHDNREAAREAHLFVSKTGWPVGAVLVEQQRK